MAKDPLGRDKFGEYGGRPGSIHTDSDGHVDLTAAEKRRINATYGIRNADSEWDNATDVPVNVGEDVNGEPWEDAEQRQRAIRVAESRKRLNGRGVADGM